MTSRWLILTCVLSTLNIVSNAQKPILRGGVESEEESENLWEAVIEADKTNDNNYRQEIDNNRLIERDDNRFEVNYDSIFDDNYERTETRNSAEAVLSRQENRYSERDDSAYEETHDNVLNGKLNSRIEDSGGIIPGIKKQTNPLLAIIMLDRQSNASSSDTSESSSSLEPSISDQKWKTMGESFNEFKSYMELARKGVWKSCGKKAAKFCVKACKEALKLGCSGYSCNKKMKKKTKKYCKTSCKEKFESS